MYMLYDSFLKNTIIKLDDDRIVKNKPSSDGAKKKKDRKQTTK